MTKFKIKIYYINDYNLPYNHEAWPPLRAGSHI